MPKAATDKRKRQTGRFSLLAVHGKLSADQHRAAYRLDVVEQLRLRVPAHFGRHVFTAGTHEPHEKDCLTFGNVPTECSYQYLRLVSLEFAPLRRKKPFAAAHRPPRQEIVSVFQFCEFLACLFPCQLARRADIGHFVDTIPT